MPISPGTRLGSYDILAKLGEGGMGEVYRARDTRLGRDVALKILPEAFASDPDRLMRFEREARTLAALNHPNIAQVYGIEDGPSTSAGSSATRALVMELVAGEDLSARIARGPIPIDEALPIARQIAEALEAAHDAGIIHRDLKPANIKVRDDGTVKVLDFGLAKAFDPLAPDAPGDAATITSPAVTMRGVILGTAAYMAPEQAKGKPVDRRADIWAFGCVLYEMLTGQRAFRGEDVSETLAFVLTRDPDWSRLAPTVPARLERLLRRLLEKNVSRRVQDIAVVRWELEELPQIGASVTPSPGLALPAREWSSRGPWLLAAAAVAAAAWIALRAPLLPAPPSRLHIRLDLGAPVSLQPIANTGGQLRGLSSSVVVSPDGRSLVFVTRAMDGATQLYLRRLDQLVATPLVGTEDAGAPFFSPDGQWIGFFADRKLKKVSTTGGAPVILCDAPGARGGTWTSSGTIVFAPTNAAALQQVPDSGGAPAPLTVLAEGEVTHRWPHALPGGRGVLFTATGNVAGPFDSAYLAVAPLSGGAPVKVLENATFGRYVGSGHLVYVNRGTLYAVPFDLDALAVTGGPTPIVDRVSYESNTGVSQVDVSASGSLVYVDGTTSEQAGAEMTWLDRQGQTRVLRRDRAAWNNPRFAPDGRRIAMDVGAGSSRDVWVYDVERDVATRLTFTGTDNAAAIWSPDGQYLAYRSNRGVEGVRNVYVQRADGVGEAVALTSGNVSTTPSSWHPSGRFLAIAQTMVGRFSDVMILTVERSATGELSRGSIEPFLATAAAEAGSKFSPDGRWLAYVSNESGRNEVYVRSFQGPEGKWQVSKAGGTAAEWSAARQELVYADLTGVKMIVPFRTDGGVFAPGSPTPWPGSSPSPAALGRGWALHPDGNRLVIDQPTTDVPLIDRVTLITQLPEELRAMSRPRP